MARILTKTHRYVSYLSVGGVGGVIIVFVFVYKYSRGALLIPVFLDINDRTGGAVYIDYVCIHFRLTFELFISKLC